MTQLKEFATLCKAIEHIARDNGLTLVEGWQELDARDHDFERDELMDAEAEAASLDGHPIRAFINVDDFKEDEVPHDGDALEYVCTGEHTVIQKILEAANSKVLDEFLNEAFEGDLSCALFD